MKVQGESGFLYLDVLASLLVMTLFCSLLYVMIMSSIKQYGTMLQEDQTLQAMILYMEEGKADWMHHRALGDEVLPDVGETSFHRDITKREDGLYELQVIAYRHGEEVHRFRTYLLDPAHPQ